MPSSHVDIGRRPSVPTEDLRIPRSEYVSKKIIVGEAKLLGLLSLSEPLNLLVCSQISA